jgi:hypothetical protein
MASALTAGEKQRKTLADQDDVVKVLYYGEQGSGKTLDLATLGRRGPVIFVNAEGGLKKRPLRIFDIPPENLWLEPATSYEQLEALYWQIRRGIEGDEANQPVGVIFDSLTEIVTTLTEVQVMRRVHGAKEKADQLGIVPKDIDVNPFKTHLDDYGVMTQQMRHLSRRFRDLPIHVGFSALSRRDVDASGGEQTGDAVTYRPQLTPAFGNDIRGYVDIVVATKISSDGQFVGITKPRFQLVGKDRFGILPTTMVNPTLDRIIAVINDELDPEEVTWRPSE